MGRTPQFQTEKSAAVLKTSSFPQPSSKKEGSQKNISMGTKPFSIRAACFICKCSVCKCHKNINSFCIISHHDSQPLIGKDTLERKKKDNPKTQPLRCHHIEQHSCSLLWLFPASRAIKMNTINISYPRHRSTQIKHSDKAILNNVIT